jgi:succinate--hydroxymethylglutarate CoA-transferase
MGAVNDRQFGVLCGLLGVEELVSDLRFKGNDERVRNREVLREILEGVMVTRTTGEWETVFEGSGMPYGPINNLEQVFGHPQALARGMVETVASGAAVNGEVKVLGEFDTSFKWARRFLMSNRDTGQVQPNETLHS